LIYFCIPALNEERTVGVVLWKLRQVMTELQRDFQIIVVDDASTDATQEVLGPYARVLPLTLVRNEKQLGYAASMEIALREAVRRSPYPKRDAVITLQADFTEDPDTVEALIKRIEAGADVVTSEPTFDEGTPVNVRRARRFFRWLVRGREWAQVGDPFSGFRAYRVMTIKRAMEGRGTSRLLSWEGLAANAELVAQSIPHSRRNDTIESMVHYKRLQRPSRFRFLGMLTQVMGMRSGKPGRAAPVALPETTIVVPAALAVELATSHRREEVRRRPPSGRGRERQGNTREPRRGGAEKRGPQSPARTRTPRPPRPEVQAAAPPVVDQIAAPVAPDREKKRRRPRRRSRKPSQGALNEQPGTATDVMPSENGAEPAASNGASAENGPAPTNGAIESGEPTPRKKSRRGRRGGRGRRRGPRPGGEEQINTSSDTENAS
jgi:hypothetical protein